MAGKQLPPSLRRELEWAVTTLTARGSANSDQLQRIHAGINAGSPMLPKRFQLFFDNCAPMEITSEEKNRIGSLMLCLEDWAAGRPWRLYQPGEWASGDGGAKATQIQIRCSESWKARLQAYCQRSGRDASGVIRTAVEEYLRDNPLWQSFADDAEDDE